MAELWKLSGCATSFFFILSGLHLSYGLGAEFFINCFSIFIRFTLLR
ncbi:hypothetical protein OKW34_007067 [Paraburkholderia youngii]